MGIEDVPPRRRPVSVQSAHSDSPHDTDEDGESVYMQDDDEMMQLDGLEALFAENEVGAEEPVNIENAAGDGSDRTAVSESQNPESTTETQQVQTNTVNTSETMKRKEAVS